MTPEAALYLILTNNAAVSTLVDTKITPFYAPQNQPLPFITYSLISNIPDRQIAASSSLAYSVVQLDLYAASYATVKQLAEAVRLALDGVRGLQVTPVGSVYIQYLALAMQRDIIPAIQSGGDVPPYRISQDYEIGNDITVPTH